MLFTALIGPYFVDWTSYRETFEREASLYVGRPVTVDGKASVRLLPTPVLSFTDIHVGEAERPDVEMERFRAEVELAPLLKGEVRIIQMAVERPRFRFDIGGLAENRGVFGAEWRLDPDRISLERLQIIEGSAVISDSANGRSWEAEAIDAVIEASTLLGPGGVEADFLLEGAPVSVRAGLGRFTNLNTIALKLSVSTPRMPVTLSANGTLHLSDDAPPSYEGTATIEGADTADAEGRARWRDFRASGAFALEPAALTVEEMQISYGATERPLIVEASGQIDFGERPRFDVVLGARQIDLDRTFAGGEQNQFAIETALTQLVGLLPRAPPPPLPGALRLEAQGVVAGGSLIQSVGVDLITAGNSWVVEDFTALLPGDTRIDLDGTLGLSAGTTFRGHARLASRRPSAFAAWWRGTAGSAARIGAFSMEADLDLTPDNQRLAGLIVTTGTGAIDGSVDILRFPQVDERIVTVGLRTERADLVETRALAELLLGKTVQAGWIEKTTLWFTAEADVLSAGGIEARGVQVEGRLEDGEFNFSTLAVKDLAGANIDARGSVKDLLEGPSGKIEASVNAANIDGAAKFLLSVLPESRAVQRLEEVAPILSPVAAEISAEAGAAGERVSVELTGSFADTHLSLRAEGAGSLAEPETLAGKLSLRADGEDSSKVLRQLGFDLLPVESAPFRVEADFDGALASAGKLKLDGAAAGIEVTYDGETSLSEGRIAMRGAFSAKSDNVDVALLLGGIALPGIGEGHPASASGQLDYSGNALSLSLDDASFTGQQVSGELTADFSAGVKVSGTLKVADASLPALAALVVGAEPGVERFDWSDRPFTAPLPQKAAFDVTFDAARLGLGMPIDASDAKVHFVAGDGKLNIDISESAFAGGILKGSVGATVDDGQADMTIRAELADVALQSLVWERVGLPTASGTFDLSFEAAGRGRSVAAIVAALSGSGSFSAGDGRLNTLNADALSAVMAAVEGDDEPNDEAARETFATLFGSGALAFGSAEGSFAIANGTVSVPTVSLAAGSSRVLAGAMFDLNTLTLESEWTVRVEEGGTEEAQPYVPIYFQGPIVRPQREVVLAPLLNLMRSRFLQRKLDELEELKRKQDEAERRAADEEANRLAEEEAELQAAADEAARLAAEAEELVTEEAERRAAEEAALTTGPTEPAADLEAEPGEPLQLQPAPAEIVPAEATPAPAAEPAPAPQPQRRRQAAPPPPPVEERPVYRTLPNGVVVKVR